MRILYFGLMKLFFGLFLTLLPFADCIAQDAHVAKVPFQDKYRTGVVATYEVSERITRDALEDRIKRYNLGRKRKQGGYWYYHNVSWPEMSATKVDLYFDVNSRNGKSVVYMMVSPEPGYFATPSSNPVTIDGMKRFLTRFNTDLIAWQEKLRFEEEQDTAEEADKKAEKVARRKKKADKEAERKTKKAEDAQRKHHKRRLAE